MSKLYEISNEFMRAIDSMIHDEEGIIVCDQLENIKENFQNKAIAVAKYIKNLEAESHIIIAATSGMVLRAKRIQNQADSLRDYLKFNIEKTGITDKISCPEFDIKLKTNPPSLVVYEESLIPENYLKKKVTITIDKVQLKKDIVEGFEVEGARIENRKQLIIK